MYLVSAYNNQKDLIYENVISLQTIVFTGFYEYPIVTVTIGYSHRIHRLWSQSPPINTFLNKNTYINLSIFSILDIKVVNHGLLHYLL